MLKAILTNSSLTSLDGGKATVLSTPKFASGAPKWITQITELISHAHGAKVEVLLRAAAGNEPISHPAPDDSVSSDAASTDTDAPPAPRSQPPSTGTYQPTDHPLVKQALEVFGGRIVDVQPRKRT